MCEVVDLNKRQCLKEVEEYCGLFYKKLGFSHNYSTIVSDNSLDVSQCSWAIFSKIESDNYYLKIVQKYLTIHHNRYKCSSKTFLSLLGCFLHYLIPIIEEKCNIRYLVQGIQETFDVLINLYRTSAKKLTDGSKYDTQIANRTSIHKDTTNYFKSTLTKIVQFRSFHNERENDEVTSINSIVNRLCHYDESSMRKTLTELMIDLIFPRDKIQNQDSTVVEKSFEKRTQLAPINPLVSLGNMIINSLNIGSSNTELLDNLQTFKENLRNVTIVEILNASNRDHGQFTLYSGLFLPISSSTKEALKKIIGLRNCLLLNGNIGDVDLNENPSEEMNKEWIYKIVMKMVKENIKCIMTSGKCNDYLVNTIESKYEIAIIQNIPLPTLKLIANIMDVKISESFNEDFAVCNMIVATHSFTLSDRFVYCSINVPRWMEIFQVSHENLKTIVIQNSSKMICEALKESLIHNMKRIENSICRGYYLEGSGHLEKVIAGEIKSRANDKLIGANRIEISEEKVLVMYATAKALEMFHFHVRQNLEFDIKNNEEIPIKLDDLESKLGCLGLLSQCLSNLFSLDQMLCCSI